jgi:hypothetical protein
MRDEEMKTLFRTKHRVLMVWLAMVASLVFHTASGSAQGFRWPEEPKNLKVLPKGTKGAQLRQVMRGFASSLDVRCQYCHVGEGSDLSKFDFPSDEKITKQKARVMIQMVQDINQTHVTQLTKLEPTPGERVEVTCLTCHRTAAKPEMLGDVLARTIEKDGIDAAIAQYRELRKSNYGGFAYDFSPGTLTALGERVASGGKVDAALRILDLEKEVNGESASIYFTRGGIEAGAGLREQAIHSFERGLELAPEDQKPFFRQALEKLRKQ